MDDLTRAPGEVTRAPGSAPSGTSTLGSSSGTGWGRFAPGTLLAGRFRIVAPLGRGGMGEVYRADDLKLGQTVALKFLPDELMRDAGAPRAVPQRGARRAPISHRNVCRVYDIGDADGRPFLTMEYVDGEDLASLLRRIGRLPQDKAIEVARQICAGLAAAHERGVLHRDLKPANVMIDGEGRVRLTDFGLAGDRRQRRQHPRRHAGLHGARAARRPRGHGAQRHLRARPGAVRAVHRQARLRGRRRSTS